MKRLRRIFISLSALIITVQSLILPVQVMAVPVDYGFYSNNDVLWYDPNDTGCAAPTGGSGSVAPVEGGADIEKTPTIERVYQYLSTTALSTNAGKPLSPVQVAGAMGNFYVESAGMNPAAVEGGGSASNPNLGHGLAQWTFNPGRWGDLLAFSARQGSPWDNLETQLRFIKLELEGKEKAILSDPEFVSTTDPAVAAQRFRKVYERASETLAHDDRRIAAAIAIYNMFGGKAAASCSTTAGAVAGDLVQTALNFALEKPASNGMTAQSDARDTYQAAKPRYNPNVDWTDCGGYIAVAMYASKVDTDFPNVSTTAQLAYIRSKPSKYVVVENPRLSDLQPGDLLYTTGHVTMYTGESSYPSVDASLNERVPSVRNSGSATWMIGNGAVLARLIE